MPRMLIVDDEPDICDCLEAFFLAKGFTVRCASTGREAIGQLVLEAPDILLLDLRLPDLWGIDVLKRAKALCPDTKVIMVTGVDQPMTRLEAEMHGALAYITKPFDFSERTWASVLAGSTSS